MSELAEFLLARIAEDEAVAHAATPGVWGLDVHRHRVDIDGPDGGWLFRGGNDPDFCTDMPEDDYVAAVHDADHIVRHTPTRTLAECEAKRVMVKRFAELLNSFDYPESGSWHDVNRRERHQARDNLSRMAAVYADHPDYRKKWAA